MSTVRIEQGVAYDGYGHPAGVAPTTDHPYLIDGLLPADHDWYRLEGQPGQAVHAMLWPDVGPCPIWRNHDGESIGQCWAFAGNGTIQSDATLGPDGVAFLAVAAWPGQAYRFTTWSEGSPPETNPVN